MELYTGQSVVDLLNSRLAKKQALSEREVLKIFSDIAVAVGRLHHRTKPIIHRDLKVGQNSNIITFYSIMVVTNVVSTERWSYGWSGFTVVTV